MSDSDSDSDSETMIIANEQCIRCSSQRRRRPPRSKRRASRDSKPRPAAEPEAKIYSTSEQEKMNEAHEAVIRAVVEGARRRKMKVEAEAAARMVVVKPMASTAFMSDSEEEAMIIAREQYIRFLREAGLREKMTWKADPATDLE